MLLDQRECLSAKLVFSFMILSPNSTQTLPYQLIRSLPLVQSFTAFMFECFNALMFLMF